MPVSSSEYKEKGNAAFKAGKFAEAVGYYSNAIVSDPTRSEPTYFLNRAAAYLKLGKYEDAERDCSSTLKLDARNVKALFRRAQARNALEKWDDSISDINNLLSIEPGNDPAKQELEKAKEGKKSTPLLRKAPSDVPYRRRVPIKIIEPPSDSNSSIPEPPKNAEPQAARITLLEEDGDSQSTVSQLPTLHNEQALPPPGLLHSTSITQSTPPVTAKPLKSAMKSSSTSSPAPARARKVGGGIFRPSGAPSPPGMTQETGADKSSATNWNLFALRRFLAGESNSKQRWDAIKTISPFRLPAFFAHSLSSEVLMYFISTFRVVLGATPSTEDEELILAFMTEFPSVERFKTVVLFLSEVEKADVRKVWDGLGGLGKETKQKTAWGL